MARMLDLIRTSQVPSNLMQSAARGSPAVTADEMIEIRVYLAVHHKLFGEQTRLTLAGWDEKSSREVAANSNTSQDLLGYLASSENLRISLVPQLAENPSVSEESLDALAVSGARPVVEALFTSSRVMRSPRLLQGLQTNPSLRPNELAEIGKKLAAMETTSESEPAEAEADASDEVIAGTVTKYLEENAAELAAEKDKPFQPIGMSLDEIAGEAEGEASPAAVAATAAAEKEVADASAAKAKKAAAAKESRRDSVLQKIAKLDIRGRITLAMRATKEDRSILIRDSTKLV